MILAPQRRFLASFAIGAVAVSTLVTGPSAQAAVPTARFDGATRFDVAVNVSQQYEPGVDVLYVAKASDYPDALSAAPAAASLGGPLLLTSSADLPVTVRAEITRLQPARIVVVGGSASISEGVVDELASLSPSVTRIGGTDRYDASRNIVRDAFGQTGASRVYLATGANFPDALAASAAAGARGGAVLLVDGSQFRLDAATRDLIADLEPSDIVIAGGANSVSTFIEDDARSLGYPLQRLSGADRYSAAAAINAEAFGTGPISNVYVATGTNFPDALTGAALAGRNGSPLFLVRGECAPTQVVEQVGALGASRVTAFGGRNSVSDAALNLEGCRPFANPTASASYDCGSGLAFSVFNPNQSPVVVTVSVDDNGDGRLDDVLTSASISAGQSYQNFSAGSLRDQVTTNVVFQVAGNTFYSQLLTPRCTQPPTANASYNCSAGLAFNITNPNSTALSAEVAYDAGGDGVLDRSVIRLSVAPRSTYTNYSAGALPEDYVDIVFLQDGISFAKKTLFVDCVAPAPSALQQWAIQKYGSFAGFERSGFGSTVVDLPSDALSGIVVASHTGSSNFIVELYDETNSGVDLLINEIGRYSGTNGFGLSGYDEIGTKLRVQANGAWSLKVLPVSSAPDLSGASNGDGVFLYGGSATNFRLTHAGTANFIVIEHPNDWFDYELIVNEIGQYDGTVPFVAGPAVVEVTADGAWTVQGR